jgi:hypothetical protein
MKASALIIAATLFCTTVWAGPAAWYKWRSPSADYQVCAQFPPGDDWVAIKGPFEDSGCKKPFKE